MMACLALLIQHDREAYCTSNLLVGFHLPFLTQNEWCAHAIPAVLVWKAPGTYTEWSGSSGAKACVEGWPGYIFNPIESSLQRLIYILYHIFTYIIFIDIKMYTVDCFMTIARFWRLFLTWLAVCSMPSRLLVKRHECWLSYIIRIWDSDHIEAIDYLEIHA